MKVPPKGGDRLAVSGLGTAFYVMKVPPKGGHRLAVTISFPKHNQLQDLNGVKGAARQTFFFEWQAHSSLNFHRNNKRFEACLKVKCQLKVQ